MPRVNFDELRQGPVVTASAEDQMRLCFVTTSLDVGGAESALVGIVEELAADGVNVQVIALRGSGRLVRRLEQGGIPTAILSIRTASGAILGLLKAARLARRQQPDIVQGWMYHGALFSCLIALTCRARVCWGIRQSLAALDRETPSTNRLIRVCARLSRWPVAIVYASHSARSDHESLGFSASRGAVIPNGVDIDRFRPDAAARAKWRLRLAAPPLMPVVGIVARMHPIKDHETFLDAAAIVASRYPRACFVLAGRGCDETNDGLMRQISSARLGGRVRVLGEVDDVPGLMAALDVLCLSSRSEAFPNVVAEGMACGVPCASTNVGDVPSILSGAGEVVPVGDSVALADAIIRLLAMSSEERDELGRVARRRAIDEYSLKASAERYSALYRACIKQS